MKVSQMCRQHRCVPIEGKERSIRETQNWLTQICDEKDRKGTLLEEGKRSEKREGERKKKALISSGMFET